MPLTLKKTYRSVASVLKPLSLNTTADVKVKLKTGLQLGSFLSSICTVSRLSALAELSYAVCQLQTVQDSVLLGLKLLSRHVSLQLLAKQHHILHEQTHRLPLTGRQFSDGDVLEAEVNTLGSAQPWTSFFDPCKRSVTDK